MPTSAFGGTSLGGGSRASATAHGCTLTTAPPIGSLLFFFTTWIPAAVFSSITDNTGSNTWNFTQQPDTGTLLRVGLGWCQVVAVPTTVTLNLATAASMAWSSARFGGDHGGYPAGVMLTQVGAGTGTGVISVSGSVPAQSPAASRLYVQVVGNNLPATGITPASGWSEIDDQGTATAACRVDAAWNVVSSASAIAAGGSGSAASWAMIANCYNTNEIVRKSAGPIQTYRTMPNQLLARR
jgi:hypothetical protein